MEDDQPKPVKLSLSEDWKIIKLLNWVGVTISATSLYNFDDQKIENLKSYRIYMYTTLSLVIFGYVYSSVGKILSIYSQMSLTTSTMDFLSSTILAIFNAIVIYSSYSDSKVKEQLLTSLVKNDMFLHQKMEKNLENLYTDFRITASVVSFTFFVLFMYDIFVWVGVFESESIKYYLFQNFLYILPIYFVLQFRETLKLILSRFQSNSNLLLHLVSLMHAAPKIEEGGNQTNDAKWAAINKKMQPRKENVMQLKLLSRIFSTLFGSIELINRLFEWKVLFLLFAAFMQTLELLNFLVAFASGNLRNENFGNVYFVFLRIGWAMLMLMLSVLIINFNVRLQSETRIIIININKTLLDTPTEELLRDEAQEELAKLDQQFMHRPILVHGVFFALNYEFLMNAFLTISSFSPVVIQFNRI